MGNLSETEFARLDVERPLPCLTIQQPWAWAICFAGKTIENRSKLHPWESLTGDVVGIHAGMSDEWDTPLGRDFIRRVSGKTVPPFEHLRRGAIVAVARVAAVKTNAGESNPWAALAWGLRLADVAVLDRPIDVRGKQGVWRITWAALTREARELVRSRRAARGA